MTYFIKPECKLIKLKYYIETDMLRILNMSVNKTDRVLYEQSENILKSLRTNGL